MGEEKGKAEPAGRQSAGTGWRRPGAPRPWIHPVIDAAIVLALVASTFVPFNGGFHLGQAPLTIILFVLSGCVLSVRRWWPLPVLAACLLLFGVAAAFGVFLTPLFAVPVAMAMFTVATRLNRRRTAIVATMAAILLTLLAQLVVVDPFVDPRSLMFVLIIVVAAALGDASKSRRRYLMAMIDRAVTAEATRESEARRRIAEDRLRIARDLHDVVAHQITVINLHASVASASLQSRPAETEASLAIIRDAARSTLTDIGEFLAQLRESASGRTPHGRLGVGLGQLDELITTFELSGLAIEGHGTGVTDALPPDRLSADTDVVAYRVVQEALTNAQKHGAGGVVHLSIDDDENGLTITVENPVDPRHAQTLSMGTGNGLLGIAERVESIAGRMHAGETGHGTYRLTARLPLAPSERSSPAGHSTGSREWRETL